eukprot:m.1208630 g.1208630  ORF g.1208630 m.1208630 type:complete len:419 (-) comp24589_c0_seq3:15-1271(-)
MKARSANLKHQKTKESASIKDMFAGEDMAAVTKHADNTTAKSNDGKSEFLQQIEASTGLKKTAQAVQEVEKEIFVGVNDTDGDPSGQHVLTLVRTTGKAITIRWEPWEGEQEAYAVLCDGDMLVVTEPGEKTAATVAPLQPKTTYRIKVIALGAEGPLGSGSAERNFSTAATGQTYSNTAATSVAAPTAAPVSTAAAPTADHATPCIPLSVVRASKTSVTIGWQPFGGATVAESKRKCFCVLQDDEMKVVTEQNEKTVAVIADVPKGTHVYKVIALNFDGTPAAESLTLELDFDGNHAPAIPDSATPTPTPPPASAPKPTGADTGAPDATSPPALQGGALEPAMAPYTGPAWAEEFAKVPGEWHGGFVSRRRRCSFRSDNGSTVNGMGTGEVPPQGSDCVNPIDVCVCLPDACACTHG